MKLKCHDQVHNTCHCCDVDGSKTCEKHLVVERRVTEFLPEGVQSLLNYLPAVWHGKLSQFNQDTSLFLHQRL